MAVFGYEEKCSGSSSTRFTVNAANCGGYSCIIAVVTLGEHTDILAI